MYSLFDSFFSPPTIIVVSEERLQAAEREAKMNRLKAVDDKLTELRAYRQTLAKELAPAEKTGKDLDRLDEATCDV
tara:strand:- start:1138 stop:1365 length:228 start_codon:yes stop_codon:yes gene_type:complete